MHGRGTPKPLQSSPLCGWPELSIGKKWKLGIGHAESAGWIGVAWGSLLLCRNIRSVFFAGALT